MCVLQGVFGDGKFTDLEDLIKAVTAIIFISSVGHSAANFAQYDEYAFPPNYPAFLRGKPPTTKVTGRLQSISIHQMVALMIIDLISILLSLFFKFFPNYLQPATSGDCTYRLFTCFRNL